MPSQGDTPTFPADGAHGGHAPARLARFLDNTGGLGIVLNLYASMYPGGLHRPGAEITDRRSPTVTRRITILGSTGSIGQSTVQVVDSLGSDYRVVGLSGNRRWSELLDQCRLLRPAAAAVADDASAAAMRPQLNGQMDLLTGPEGLVEIASRPESDFVVAAIVGAAGLRPTLAAVEAGKDVGLANKEALVIAGSLLMPLAKRKNVRILPIDSEHSAVFQAMASGRSGEIHKIYLTASGGPFRTWSADRIAQAAPEDALRHPTWDMGPKITIDSATMMNKALEIIEACWLFDLPPDAIEVLIHPESVIHSMVEFCDGSVIAQLGTPDMKTPIQYALTYPHRATGCAERLDFHALRKLHFEPPDMDRFPALRLGYEVARAKGTAGAVLNAANEQAVAAFLEGHIPFGRIVELTERVLDDHVVDTNPTLETLLTADAWARQEVNRCLNV